MIILNPLISLDMAKGVKEFYVIPKEFKDSLRAYYETDILTDDLADNIKKIAYGLSFNPSFINYSYKEEMIGDALIKMYSALKFKKYNFDANSNPFSYFTTIAFHAFINRIKKEKRHHETLKNYRDRVYEDSMIESSTNSGHSIYVKPMDSDYYDGYNSEEI